MLSRPPAMQPPAPQKRGYSIDEVVALGALGKRSTVYELIANGTLTVRKLGSRTIVLAEDLERAIASLPVLKSKKRKRAA